MFLMDDKPNCDRQMRLFHQPNLNAWRFRNLRCSSFALLPSTTMAPSRSRDTKTKDKDKETERNADDKRQKYQKKSNPEEPGMQKLKASLRQARRLLAKVRCCMAHPPRLL
jgi:ubiquitin